mgnify:CR=1 FL=1
MGSKKKSSNPTTTTTTTNTQTQDNSTILEGDNSISFTGADLTEAQLVEEGGVGVGSIENLESFTLQDVSADVVNAGFDVVRDLAAGTVSTFNDVLDSQNKTTTDIIKSVSDVRKDANQNENSETLQKVALYATIAVSIITLSGFFRDKK